MRKSIFLLAAIVALWGTFSCNQKPQFQKPVLNADLQGSINRFSKTTFDSTLVDSFFTKHSGLSGYRENVKKIYYGQKFHHIWFDENGLVEFASAMYSKV